MTEPVGQMSLLGTDCVGFSPVAANGGYSLLAVCGLLTMAASPVAESGLSGTRALVVAAPEFAVVVPRL